MEAKAKLFGHPIHQMLIVLPLGLLIAAWFSDIGFFVTDRPALKAVGFWNTAGGIATGLLAAVFGLIDWMAVPVNTRAKRVGAWHAGINVLMLVLFSGSLLIRYAEPSHAPNLWSFVCATLAVGSGSVSGWLGGELVNRLGIGVSPGANVDAPSSLSGPAARSDSN